MNSIDTLTAKMDKMTDEVVSYITENGPVTVKQVKEYALTVCDEGESLIDGWVDMDVKELSENGTIVIEHGNLTIA